MRQREHFTKADYVLGTIVIVVLFLIIGKVGYWETHYDMNCVVTQYDTIVDTTGNKWEYHFTEEDGDIKVGDHIKVLFCTNGTDSTRYDDTIEEIELIQSK